ncbi:sugar phosphate isomerase/epimerase [Oceanispirochaeta sp.]|uniref:sugar phosphate isomerase/epimerase family protein n=1 Tax=Oceanispirochaeta sp. TaxID=2035350 RepID=UPI002612166D|nr:sugar phosphate isomerase/epimerase family protein [Oceanispirochaeta sp.]MDA3955089.1 sugar phosphate isomerase/epimerase [Oceanispirochaeta sp.]
MNLQNFELKNKTIKERFDALKKERGGSLGSRLNLSWSNWGFGLEDLDDSLKRLSENGVPYIELHGNHYGDDLGYSGTTVNELLKRYDIQVSGICGMYSVDNDFSANRPVKRQAALDYTKREISFIKEVGGDYILVVPGAVGRSVAYDNAEFLRSSETIRMMGDLFVHNGIKAAVEPIRRDEVSLVHSIEDAKEYIAAVNHPGIRHINGDLFHMQAEEDHIPQALISAGSMLTNLHMADSNRRALGEGSLDLDTIIMALYLIDYNRKGCYVTPEPLGPGSDPYQSMNRIPDQKALDHLVSQTVRTFREREDLLRKS